MLHNIKQNLKTLPSYIAILEMKSQSTQKLFQCTINNIEIFGKIDIRHLSRYSEDKLYDLLQEWVIWNARRGITTASIMCYLNAFRSYLWYCKTNIDWNYLKHNLKVPQQLYQQQTPITPDIIKKILSASSHEFRFQLLALISSGMRVGELGQIRSEHLDFTHQNITVQIPAHITKNGRSRTTFFSKQVSDMIRYRIKNTAHFTLCGNRTSEQSRNLIIKRFSAARTKTNMKEKYEYCKQNRYKIHVHSLRSYFITRANQVQFGLGHILAGHNFYMRQYNQHTTDELLEMYKKFEVNLKF